MHCLRQSNLPPTRLGLISHHQLGPGILAMCLICGALLSSCAPDRGRAQTSAPKSSTESVLAPTIVAPAEPTSSATRVLALSQPVTLTVWLPADFWPLGDGTSSVIAEAHSRFLATNPHTNISTETKALHGSGGMIDLLLATGMVLPERLPDVAVVDLAEIGQLLEAGRVMPLDEWLPSDIWDELYPFADAAAQSDKGHMALPFQVDTVLMAYNRTLLVGPPPATWSELVASKANYLLPLAGEDDTIHVLAGEYLARGGVFTDATGRPYLDATIFASLLSDVSTALMSGAILPRSLTLETWEACWRIYVAGDAILAQVPSKLYLRDHELLQRTGLTTLPTAGSEPFGLVQSWGWVVLANDPEQQKLAARYLVFMSQPDVMLAWMRESYYLSPVREFVRELVEDDDLYNLFDEQLSSSKLYRRSDEWDRIQQILLQATADVIDGIASPERAAVSAAAKVARLR